MYVLNGVYVACIGCSASRLTHYVLRFVSSLVLFLLQLQYIEYTVHIYIEGPGPGAGGPVFFLLSLLYCTEVFKQILRTYKLQNSCLTGTDQQAQNPVASPHHTLSGTL